MASTIMQSRLTHRYRAHCSYMDDWASLPPVYQMERIARECRDEDADYGTIMETHRISEAAQDLPEDVLFSLVKDTIGDTSCGHEYDCCGCVSTRVSSVRRINTELVEVERTFSRNI